MLFHRSQMSAIRSVSYPVIPSGWPNRAIRRAVKQGRLHRLAAPWRAALTTTPGIAQAIRRLP
jgi:hypothetical protein